MHFEWDDTKYRQNQHKHGIALGLAQEVFLDLLRITMETQDIDGEERFVTIGSITRTFRLMVVVYTLRLKNDDETVRIISARKATPNERKFYENAHQI
jgi:uncharacterized DUF497 family protein